MARGPAKIRRHSLALIAALGVAAHGSGVANGFVFDDKAAILDNAVVRGPFDPMALLSHDFWGLPAGSGVGTWRPLVTLSFILDWRLAGGEAWLFHLVNIALHAGTAVLLALAAARYLNDARVCIAAGAIFAVLAGPSEAIDGIVGRADVVALGLCMLAWWWLGPATKRTPPKNRWLAAGAFALALCAKESAIAFPIWLIAADRLLAERRPAASIWARYGGLAASLAGVVALRTFVFALPGVLARDPLDNPLTGASAASRILTALGLTTKAMATVLVPTRLSADYSYAALIPVHRYSNATSLLGLGVLVALGVLAWRQRHARRGLTVGACAFLVSWVAVSNAVWPLPVMFAERLLYAPAAGVALMLATALEAWQARAGGRLAWGATGLLIALNLGRSAVRSRDWASDLTLFAAATRSTPRSARAWTNWGAALMNDGRSNQSRDALKRAIEIAPASHEAHALLGALLYQQGDRRAGEAEMRRAVELGPDDAKAAFNLALALAREGRLAEAKDALGPFVAKHPWRQREVALLRQIETDLAPAADAPK